MPYKLSGFRFPGQFIQGTSFTLSPNLVSSGWCVPSVDAFGVKKSVIAGDSCNILAIKTDGTLWGWGGNNCGQLGQNTTTAVSSPTQVLGGGNNWCAVYTARDTTFSPSTVGLKTDGSLWLWGAPCCGKLGNGSSPFTAALSPIQTIAQGNNWRSAAISQWHTAGIKTDGTLWTWGNNVTGLLGDNTTINRSSPVQVPGNNWRQVSINQNTSAAIKTDGTLWTWGRFFTTGSGLPFTGYNLCVRCPVQTSAGGNNWKFDTETNAIDRVGNLLSLQHYLKGAVKTDGTLWVWGCGQHGIGSNNYTCISSPVQVPGSNWARAQVHRVNSIALKSDGTLWTWGCNSCGALGDGTSTNFGEPTVFADRSSPVQTIAGGNNWCAIGNSGSCRFGAIKTDGTLWMWGTNYYGQLGNNSTANASSPVQTVAQGNNWKKLSLGAGGFGAAAIKTDGTLWVWGSGRNGNLGSGNTLAVSSPIQTITGGTNWISASTNCSGTIAIKSDNTLWAWGCSVPGVEIFNRSSPVQVLSTGCWRTVTRNQDLANYVISCNGTLWGWTDSASGSVLYNICLNKTSPVQIGTRTDWLEIGSGSGIVGTSGNSCLISWGRNYHGQLGNNTCGNCCNDLSSPIQTVAGGNNWKQVSTAASGAVAVKTDGTLWLWGSLCDGAVGNGLPFDSINHVSSPIQTIAGGTDWAHACFLSSNGRPFAHANKCNGNSWNWGSFGTGASLTATATPNNFARCILEPIRNINLDSFAQIITSATVNAGINNSGNLFTWGCNTCGAFGLNRGIEDISDPRTLGNFKDLSAVFLRKDVFQRGSLWSWGLNTGGVLGNNSSSNLSSPVQIAANSDNWRTICSGGCNAVAIRSDGTLWTWGCGVDGQLGNGQASVTLSSPIQIGTSTDWKVASASGAHMLAIKTDGSLWAWGNAACGKFGNGYCNNACAPVQIFTLSAPYCRWRDVVATPSHSMALSTGNELFTWGNNSCGQLGILAASTAYNICRPCRIDNANNWCKAFSSYRFNSIALRTNGSLWAWGEGCCGKLGIGSVVNVSSPAQVFGGNNWATATIGKSVGAGISIDGRLWTWGCNGNGSLGTNDTIDRSSPVQTIAGGNDWRQVVAGSESILASKTNGTLWGIGRVSLGNCTSGDASTTAPPVSSPVQLLSGTTGWLCITGNGCTNFALISCI